MSKVIKVTDEIKEQLVRDFSNELEKYKSPNGEFCFKSKLGALADKAELHFTEAAYAKMMMLVHCTNDEVGWHGVARRDESENSYTIEDVMVYPQTVTAAHVDTDEGEYTKWLYSLPDDTFDGLRFQGHSHVNMSATPSSTDKELYQKLLRDIPDDDFYIFLIINKRKEYTVFIYDLLKNRLFENADVSIFVDDGDIGLQHLEQEVASLVKKATSPAKAITPVTKCEKPASSPTNSARRTDGYKPKYPYSWYDDDSYGDAYRDW